MSELIYLWSFYQEHKQGEKALEKKVQELIWASRLYYTHLLSLPRETQPNPSLWAPRIVSQAEILQCGASACGKPHPKSI